MVPGEETVNIYSNMREGSNVLTFKRLGYTAGIRHGPSYYTGRPGEANAFMRNDMVQLGHQVTWSNTREMIMAQRYVFHEINNNDPCFRYLVKKLIEFQIRRSKETELLFPLSELIATKKQSKLINTWEYFNS
jgi:hypothetical protein